MIPINNIISIVTKYYHKFAVIIILMLTAFLFYTGNKLKVQEREIDRLGNNFEYYQDLLSNTYKENRVLQLNVNEFKETKDSLIQEIKTVQKKLKIKDKELQLASIQEVEIKYDTTVVVTSDDFTLEIKPNTLTSIIIEKKDSLLKHTLDIRNSQTLFIKNEKVYKRQYKNWFRRLLHFDFKKKNICTYQIDNSNSLIKIENTRFVELSK